MEIPGDKKHLHHLLYFGGNGKAFRYSKLLEGRRNEESLVRNRERNL